MSDYNRYSPYKNTNQSWYLDIYDPIKIPSSTTDEDYVIPQKYHQRPWMLAKEKYNNERLYFVFAILNMNIIKDPLYDFKAGTTIKIPTNERVQKILGSR